MAFQGLHFKSNKKSGKNCSLWSNAGEREKGFTLIEILIAIFIFAIVISSVYGSYRATFHIIHGSESRLVIAKNARVVVERLAEDLGSLVTGTGGEFKGETHELAGAHGDSLAFVSLAHLILRKSDLHAGQTLIQYQAESDDKTGLLNLYRSEIPLLPGVGADSGKAQKRLMCQGLREISFTYLGRDGDKAEEWQVDEVVPTSGNAASKESPFPALVYIELKFAESAESDSSTLFRTAVALP